MASLPDNLPAQHPPMTSLEGIWEQLQSSLLGRRHDHELLCEWADAAISHLHERMLLSAEYQQLIHQAQTEQFDSYNLVIPLFRGDFLRANIVSIVAERELPLHDHPDASGITLLIDGHAQITQCELDGYPVRGNNTDCQLTVISDQVYTAGEISCFTTKQRNIHRIKALTHRCSMLVIHISPLQVSKQSYFFASSPQAPNTNRLQTLRVPAKTLRSNRLSHVQH